MDKFNISCEETRPIRLQEKLYSFSEIQVIIFTNNGYVGQYILKWMRFIQTDD